MYALDLNEMNDSKSFPRAILWSTYRSVSTAFERSIRELGDVMVTRENFSKAACFGEERIAFKRYHVDEPVPGCKFSDIKILLEGTFPGYRGVFMKEVAMALVLSGKIDFVPDGFSHVFLIRNPVKVVTSFYMSLISEQLSGEKSETVSNEAGFVELWELYQYIRDIKGQTPMVIDADDDLLRDPATTMKKFCDFAGFEFKESMLHWQPGRLEDWSWDDAWYGTVVKSSGFITNEKHRVSEIDVSSYPEYVQDVIRDCQPYYEKLYNLRAKPA
ncbi:uncharacterized protein [Ptychodera flava]|uniref:uncharacterized protein n=1 Tax=Ptychodera flava TaxID=63121 RepID=UPI00396AA842